MLTSKWFIGFLGLCVIGVFTFFFGKPIYLKFKDVRAGQLANQALESYLTAPSDSEVIRMSLDKAQSALFLSSINYEANRTLATIMVFSNPVVSLKYWEQSRVLWTSKDAIDALDQLHYVQSLILNSRLPKALEVLKSIQTNEELQADVLYNLVKVSYLMGDKSIAIDYGREMIANRHTPIGRHLFFADMCLVSQDEEIRKEGEKHVRFLLLNEDLMDDSVLWQMTQLTNLSPKLSQQLESTLNDRITDFEERISLMNYRVANGIITQENALGELMKALDRSDQLAVIRLAEWCNINGFSDEVIELMNLDLALKRKDWFVMYIKNLGLINEWERIILILTKEDCPIETFLSDILKCEAYYSNGDNIKAINSWYRAKLSSHPVANDLWLLVRIGDKMELEQDTEKMLRELVIVGENPERVLGYVASREMSKGNFDEFYRLLSGFKELYNNVGSIVNDWAYYSILMDRDYDGAMFEIQKLIDQNPKQLRYHMTWALGQIKKAQYREVLARFQHFDLDWMELHPKWRLILALALAGVGEYEQGQAYLEDVDMQSFNSYELELYEKLYYYRKNSKKE